MVVKPVVSKTPPTDQVFAQRGAIALMIIAMLEVAIGLLTPATNKTYALISGTNANLFSVPWWAFALIAVALGVLLLLTYPPSRHYLQMHGKVRLFNSPSVIASFAVLWAAVSWWGSGSYSAPERGLYVTAAVVSLGVAIAGSVIDYRQDGVIPFFIRGFGLVFGRKNKNNRVRTEHQAAEAYAKIPSADRLPVFTKAGRWAIAPTVTLLLTTVLAAARVVTPIYLLFGLIGTATTGLLVVVILHNLYARRTGIFLDLPSPFVTSYRYLPDQLRGSYHLRESGVKVSFLFGFADLAAFVVSAVVWMGAVFLWTPIVNAG